MTILLGVVALMLFALSTDAHHLRQFGQRPLPRLKRALRGGAWGVLAVAFACAVMLRGWVYGPLAWVGAVMLGAGVTFVLLNLLPPLRRGA